MATKPRTIDEYLAGVSPENRAALQKVRLAVHAAAPGADECISYGMPAFRLNGKLIAGFKAAANHCSFHPMSGDTAATLEADLTGYDTSRGTIRSRLVLACRPHSFASCSKRELRTDELLIIAPRFSAGIVVSVTWRALAQAG